MHRGDIIVFKKPGDDINPGNVLVKRAVGLGGDTLEVRDKAFSSTAGRPPTARKSSTSIRSPIRDAGSPHDPRDQFGPYRVPPGDYFGMGDNRDNSLDSRFWGPIPRENIFGRPFLIYWSYEAEPNSHIWRGTARQDPPARQGRPPFLLPNAMGPDVHAGPLTFSESPPGDDSRRGAAAAARALPGPPASPSIFALFVRTFLVQAFVVPTPSMEKTVLVGDHLLVNKFVFAPHRAGPLARLLLPYRHAPSRRCLRLQVPGRSPSETSSRGSWGCRATSFRARQGTLRERRPAERTPRLPFATTIYAPTTRSCHPRTAGGISCRLSVCPRAPFLPSETTATTRTTAASGVPSRLKTSRGCRS